MSCITCHVDSILFFSFFSSVAGCCLFSSCNELQETGNGPNQVSRGGRVVSYVMLQFYYKTLFCACGLLCTVSIVLLNMFHVVSDPYFFYLKGCVMFVLSLLSNYNKIKANFWFYFLVNVEKVISPAVKIIYINSFNLAITYTSLHIPLRDS